MPEHTIGTREEWQTARNELAKIEADQAKLNEQAKQKRLALPWVPVEKEYEFDTEDGKKTLSELFDGRSQLLAYNVMFGPDYTLGACPGCTSLADGLDGSLVHLNHRDVTLICFSRAPIERLTAYKQRMGWEFPYVSTYNTDFALDFGLVLTEQQAQSIPEVKEMIDNPPEWLEEWSGQIGADLKDGLRENPAGSPSPARTAPSTTPTPCRPPTRSSRHTSASWKSEPPSPDRRATDMAEGRIPRLTPDPAAPLRLHSETRGWSATPIVMPAVARTATNRATNPKTNPPQRLIPRHLVAKHARSLGFPDSRVNHAILPGDCGIRRFCGHPVRGHRPRPTQGKSRPHGPTLTPAKILTPQFFSRHCTPHQNGI